MDPNQGLGGASEIFEAQTHIFRHIFSYANSMALGCALELGIPDIIHNHARPITVQELALKLNLPIEKTLQLQRLMCLLIHSNFFSTTKFYDQENKDEREGYVLTISSKLLLRDNSQNVLPSLLPFAKLILDPVFVTPWKFLGRWFNGSESTVFETTHRFPIWEFADKNPWFNRLFNDAMASDSQMMSLVVKDTKEIFEGVDSLVDVGGGTGVNAKIILETFPYLKCTIFDLPHVISGMIESQNLKFIGGDMFTFIPSADAVLFKTVLHNWSDEDVLKILKRSKEAILLSTKDGKKGKVIIIDMVIDNNHDRHDVTEIKLVFDIQMMVMVTGKERTKDEWEKLFMEAGFNGYKITPIFGLRSVIEVFL